jgi:hypothetical protein
LRRKEQSISNNNDDNSKDEVEISDNGKDLKRKKIRMKT